MSRSIVSRVIASHVWTSRSLSILPASFALLIFGTLTFLSSGCSDDSGSGADLLGTSSTQAAELGTELQAGDGTVGPPGGGDRPDLEEELGLSDEQAESVFTAMGTFMDGMKVIREGLAEDSMTYEDAIASAESLSQTLEESLSAILTEEQMVALDELRRTRTEERITRMEEEGGERLAQHLARMTSVLGLSDAQVDALSTILTDAAEARLAVLGRVLEGEISHAVVQIEMLRIQGISQEEFHGLLTEEQLEILESRPSRGGHAGGPGDGEGGPRGGGPRGGGFRG